MSQVFSPDLNRSVFTMNVNVVEMGRTKQATFHSKTATTLDFLYDNS